MFLVIENYIEKPYVLHILRVSVVTVLVRMQQLTDLIPIVAIACDLVVHLNANGRQLLTVNS